MKRTEPAETGDDREAYRRAVTAEDCRPARVS